jgi:hypothetical protein
MVVRDVELFGLPVLIGVYELVREVLLGGVLLHLDTRSSDYPRVAGAGLRLHPENFRNKIQWGLIPKKASQK